jgi:signal peptidase I
MSVPSEHVPKPASASASASTPPVASSDARTPAATPAPARLNEMDESRWERLVANFKTISGAVLLALVIRTCLFEAFEIEGPSMEPTLLNGDRVVVAKYAFGLFLPLRDQADFTWGAPEVGDVVIIKSPADGVDIVKRVIGVAGDSIEMRADRVYRNGKPLPMLDDGACKAGMGAHQPDCRIYRSRVGARDFRISTAQVSLDPMPIVVPKHAIYVLGDHRDHSNDSRNPMVGAVPISRVKGRAQAIYWSSGPDGLRWSRMFHAVQ